MKIKTVGSVCSGIEAASVAWKKNNYKFNWFSEIADFPSQVLKTKYPGIPNLGDMNKIPNLIESGEVEDSDLICGGTPCQAFSLAGWKKGLNDDRGNLTLKFVDIIEANDLIRENKNKNKTIIFWENVEGVLKDKTNAFGCLISSLAGLENVIDNKKWPNAGIVRGPKRNVAWRVLDAKYFGVPQQRRRLYLLAGGKDFCPENVLFENNGKSIYKQITKPLKFEKYDHKFEVFREYTDCLYAAYGTKWNGNAAAYNGSLYVVQDDKIRRLSPVECERLMGFPDNYTNIEGASYTKRYQAIGNSWAVPVVEWIGNRLENVNTEKSIIQENNFIIENYTNRLCDGTYIGFDNDISDYTNINCTEIPDNIVESNMKDIISIDAPQNIYISPVGCTGILRRKDERNINMNERLENVMKNISSQMSFEEIEKISRRQKRATNNV